MKKNNEQRQMERFSLELPSQILLDDGEDTLELETENVCAGGAFFKTDQILPEGTEVKLELVIPLDRLKMLEGRQTLVRLTGKVIRTESGGMAIQFGKQYRMVPLKTEEPASNHSDKG